jgi:hypothetical protein
MDAMRSRVSAFLALIAAVTVLCVLFASGSGVSSTGSNSGRIWGDVTLNGEPAPDGTIVFMPTDRNMSNWGAGAIKKGRYVVGSWQGNGVLESGQYTIFFRFNDPKIPLGSVKLSRFEEEKALQTVEKQPAPFSGGNPALERFTKPETSGLTITLRKEPSRVDIRLKG